MFFLEGHFNKGKDVLMKSLIAIASSLAVIAVGSGKLPWILLQVRKAQIQLIIDSQASKWPKAMTLPDR
jgi:hypothetical protein